MARGGAEATSESRGDGRTDGDGRWWALGSGRDFVLVAAGRASARAVGEGELDPEQAGRLTGTGRPAGEGGASDVGGPGGARVRGEVKTNGA